MTRIIDGAIDCDIHPGVPEISALLPYMEPFWQESFVARGLSGFDMMSYPPNAPIACRADWRERGQRPGASLANLRRDVLNGFGAGLAICNPLTGGQVAVSETMGGAICGAVNDWVVEHWLDREPRLRASIVIPAQAPWLAVEEIEKRAADPRFVQILMPVACEMMLGRSYYWPIYQAAVKHGLPIGLHAGSMHRYAPTSGGWPSHHLHDYVAQSQVFEDQMLSLVSNGIFNRFPALRVVLLESGVTWLPGFMWRAVKTWRGVRAEVPWVKRPPAEILRDHVRLSIQPFDAPRDAQTVQRIIDMIDDDRMLLFASDYPHWQFDGGDVLPPGLPDGLLRRICIDNPRETYPRLKETVA